MRHTIKMAFLLITNILMTACSAISDTHDFPLSSQKEVGNIQVLSSKSLNFSNYKHLPFLGISDLAWDSQKKILYAISDHGVLFHFSLDIHDKQIQNVSLVDAYALKDQQGKVLTGAMSDSEGLSLSYNADQRAILSISFEQKPRIVNYTTKGEFLNEVDLPKPLQDINNYRHANKALEAIVDHPKYGLITAAEYPLRQHKEKQQYLYSTTGLTWQFPASSAKNSAVTALELLANGNILVLERAWAGIFHPLVINLSEIMINNCSSGEICPSKNVARLSTDQGWQLDNFEGLTRLEKNTYLMISDDNAKPIQNTILVLFEIQK